MDETDSMLHSRRQSIPVRIGEVTVGGNAPIVVQSMTDTPTADVERTVKQVKDLARAGSELVRITVNDHDAAQAVPEIRDQLHAEDITVPLIGDFHFNGHELLSKYPECAKALDKFRVNPGNVGRGKARDPHFTQFIELACEHEKPVRIGVNWGSLDPVLLAELMDENAKRENPLDSMQVQQEAMVQSALRSAEMAEQIGLPHDAIILSVKLSRIEPLVNTYLELARLCDYPLHLGLTEAGMGRRAIVATTSALTLLLQQGVGDTLRASLTPLPGGDRADEVRVLCDLLQSLNLRHFTPSVTACPGCGRTSSDFFRRLARDIEQAIADDMPQWRKQYPGVANMTVAVMGCVVNGPGESRHANIGISLPGSRENPGAPVYVDGERVRTLRGDTIAEDFRQMLDDYVQEHYGQNAA